MTELLEGKVALVTGSGSGIGRAAGPREVADAFVYLASPGAAYVSGVALVMDAGELSG